MSRVLLLLTEPDPRWAALVHRVLDGGLDLGGDVATLKSPAGAWALFKEMRALGRFDVIAADSEAEHWAAVLYKFFARHPVAVLKTRFAGKPLPPTRLNHWRHNRMTAANLFLSRDEEASMRIRDDRTRLWMDNPYVLAQEKLGEDSAPKMLAHACQSLLKPTRDDAVSGLKRDLSHLKLAYVTHFYLNQQGKASVLDLLNRYAQYDPKLLDRIHFVVVDDGSPLKVEPPEVPLNLTWLRVRQDIAWNQAGARNLGALYARADAMLVTDLDHEFPEATLRRMVERGGCGKRIYKFWRRDGDGHFYKCHPNTFFLSRGRYFELHGYDEEFAGAYGAEDVRFMKYQKAHGSLSTYLSKDHWCIERRDIDRGKGYHSLTRDHSINTPVDYRKRLELEWHGPEGGHSRAFLNFEWEVAGQRWRDVAIERPVRRWWKRLSPLRQILPRF
jgi:hypothetical protein